MFLTRSLLIHRIHPRSANAVRSFGSSFAFSNDAAAGKWNAKHYNNDDGRRNKLLIHRQQRHLAYCQRSFSSSNIIYNDKTDHHHHHHASRNEHSRHKLHIGFASLSNTLPFDSDSSTSNQLVVGDTQLSPQATIMLTALRGNVVSFDTPAPPFIESNKQLLSSPNGDTCWMANRHAEKQLVKSFNMAWDVLVEEDDEEACHILRGDDGDGSGSGITMTTRLGYRSAIVLSNEQVHDSMDDTDHTATDSQEREGKFEGDARVGMLYAGKEKVAEEDGDESSVSQPAVVLVHNLGEEYLLHSLRTSPLVQQYKLNTNNDNENGDGVGVDGKPQKKIRLISLAHNPETQIAAYLLSNHHQQQENNNSTLLEQAHDYMKQGLTSAFIGYETAVKEGLIDGYGVDSNGLSLPTSHDMHFDWRDVLECAVDAYLEVHGSSSEGGGSCGRSSLKVIRLPGNVLETRGLAVASEIRSFFGNSNDDDDENCTSQPSEEGLPSFTDDQNDAQVRQRQKLRKLRNILPKSLGVYVTRPLTAYPYGGTGWGPSSTPGLTEHSGAPPFFLQRERGGWYFYTRDIF